MDITAIITELVAGGVGGNIAGVVLKNSTSARLATPLLEC